MHAAAKHHLAAPDRWALCHCSANAVDTLSPCVNAHTHQLLPWWCMQVHKARLRRFQHDQLRRLQRRERGLMAELTVQPGGRHGPAAAAACTSAMGAGQTIAICLQRFVPVVSIALCLA